MYMGLKEANQKGLVTNDKEIDLKNSKNLLVIFCVPVLSFKQALNSVKKHLPSQNIIFTDTLSTKTEIFNALLNEFSDILGNFVLSHPIAGSEKSSLHNSKKALFEKKVVVISPHEKNNQNDIDKVINFWGLLGSSSKILSYKDHDFLFSKTSHLPHVVAYNIVKTVMGYDEKIQNDIIRYSAGGLRDFTRIAASDPTMWRDIFIDNSDLIIQAIDKFSKNLDEFKKVITDKDSKKLLEIFNKSKELRKSIIKAGQETDKPDFGRK